MKCEVVQDLLPIYEDDLCDEVTKKEIENHLVACNECKKQLEEYRKEITLNRAEKEDLDKVEPLKKSKKKQKILIVISLFLALLLALFVYSNWCEQEETNYFNINYIRLYFKSKKQANLLLDGKIDEYVDNVKLNRENVEYKGKIVDVDIDSAYSKELNDIYNTYIKNKGVKITNYKLSNCKWQEGLDQIGSCTVDMRDSNSNQITIIYGWKGNKCYHDLTIYINEKEVEQANEKLNVFMLSETDDIKNVAKKFDHVLSFFTYESQEQKDEFKNRIHDINDITDVQVLNKGQRLYDSKNNYIYRDFTITFKDKKTGKLAIIKHRIKDCYRYYEPTGDTVFIANDGISKELEEKLLKLFK